MGQIPRSGPVNALTGPHDGSAGGANAATAVLRFYPRSAKRPPITCGQKGSPSVAAHRMRLNVSRAASSVIRIMRARLNERAALLSKNCCDIGPNPVSGSDLAAAVEIERQLDYIPGDDHDDGA